MELWRRRMAAQGPRPTLALSLADWENGGVPPPPPPSPPADAARDSPRDDSASALSPPRAARPSSLLAALSPPPGEARLPSAPPARRSWVLPLGSTLSWRNDLPVAAEVLIGGMARRLQPGEQADVYMHTLGFGRFKWRRAADDEDGDETDSSEMASVASSRGSSGASRKAAGGGWCAAEVKVLPADGVTQLSLIHI